MRIGSAPALSTSVRGGTLSASPSMISNRPGQCAAISASAPSARASRSIAITFCGAFREQRAGEAAGSGADLDDGDACERPRGAGDFAGEVEVEQEILAQRLAGLKPMRRDHVAEARQAVGREAHRVSRSASLSAAIRLAGLATPFPAMSNAVPWSGEVRTNGRPSVTLTPSSKASVLTGIRPWS